MPRGAILVMVAGSWTRWAALIGSASVAVALTACGGGGGGGTSRTASPSGTSSGTGCPAVTRAQLVPRSGVLYGVNLDWGSETLGDYASRLGHHPSVAVWFTDFPLDAAGRERLQQSAVQVKDQGAILLLTLQPGRGLATVTDAAAADLGGTLDALNRQGVPVIVRFAHEMNGSWYAWGQQPRAYVAAFGRIATAVHRLAPGSATMWAPNYGGGYPFLGGRYAARKGSADYRALDTDGNGVVDGRDDPYAPYWPGDDAVDWVGVSLYHWGNTYPWGANVVPEAGKFAAQLAGTYAGAGGDDRAVPDFYDVYGVQHDKPVAIPETAALVNTSRDTRDALAIKQAWWRQILAADVPTRFPRLKMINWFEWNKDEAEVHARVDWTATVDAATRQAFTGALPAWLSYGRPAPCFTPPA